MKTVFRQRRRRRRSGENRVRSLNEFTSVRQELGVIRQAPLESGKHKFPGPTLITAFALVNAACGHSQMM